MSKQQTNRVGVYGSLKQGFGNHRVMQQAGGKLVGEATMVGATMYSLGAFPGLILDNNTSPIHLEVYEVQDMQPLDWLEGFPDFYNRRIVSTSLGDCWVYHLNNENPRHLTKVESGKWE